MSFDKPLFHIPNSSSKYKTDNIFSILEAQKAYNFHKQIQGYTIMPLANLKNVFIKDENYRFNLNAFKVLCGSYPIVNFLCQKLGLKIEDTTFLELAYNETREKIGDITFTTTTDGNHKRGIAWAEMCKILKYLHGLCKPELVL